MSLILLLGRLVEYEGFEPWIELAPRDTRFEEGNIHKASKSSPSVMYRCVANKTDPLDEGKGSLSYHGGSDYSVIERTAARISQDTDNVRREKQ